MYFLKPSLCLLIIIKSNIIFSQTSSFSYPWLNHKKIFETIESRFPPHSGFQRVRVPPSSFSQWLRGLPLLPDSTPVRDYLGQIKVKAKDTTLAAVINYNIRGKKLEQCMDIINRFRAEYLRSHNRHEKIAFYLPTNFLLKWSDWKQGFRPHHQGIKITLVKNHPPDSSLACYEKYLWEIFYHSNSQTAYFNFPKIEPENIQIGDFIVNKGRRGHAVLIVDLATDSSGNKIALIGQGGTPAQQFYLLNYEKGHPWFPVNSDDEYPPLPIKKKMYWIGLRRFE